MTRPRESPAKKVWVWPGVYCSSGRHLVTRPQVAAQHTTGLPHPGLGTRQQRTYNNNNNNNNNNNRIQRCYSRFSGSSGLIIIIIIIIIAFKGAIRDFLQSPHSAANCLQHARSSGLGAIVYKSRATHLALFMCKCHVKCHLVQRDSSAIKFDRVEIAFIWALFYWLNH